MTGYILRRLFLMIPTLLGILLINFVIIQAAPGGPVEQMIVKLTTPGGGASDRLSGGGDMSASAVTTTSGANGAAGYRGAQGIDPDLIAEIKKQYGFDKPAPERFWLMLKSYAKFDFGNSFFRDASVISLIKEKLPVSISLGLWTTLIVYLVSIPLGIRKAVHDGTKFDVWTSTAVAIGQAIPGFLFAVLLLIVFAGGSYLQWFPLRGIVSDDWHTLSWFRKIADYLWHMALPVTAMVVGGFASLTLLTKNSFIEEISKQYVMTARAKGISERRVLYGHVFRNAMLIVIAGLPAAILSILFTSALLIEVIFSLDGLGLLGFEAAIGRDYPVMFATLFIFTLIGLVLKLIGDITYMLVDPRIDFEGALMSLSPITKRRIATFRANRRGYYSAIILLTLFLISAFAECIANDKPLLVSYKGHLLMPIFMTYTEKDTFGGAMEGEADYADPWVINEIKANGWMVKAPLPYDYRTINFRITRAPSAPSAENLLGTDDQARDVLARIIYGFRLSMCFAILLVAFSSVIGITVGALSGYFGGWLDLFLQRFIEIWDGIPVLFLLIILSSMVTPNFWWVLGLMLLFRWMNLVDVVRAEFLRTRNFDYVRAARALGLPELTILRRHVLPNALISVFTFLPFLVTGAITTLTSLDFLGFGLPLGSPSLGELLAQGKNNPQSPWLGLIGFFTLAFMLSLWLFVGEAVRDAFNPRKIFVRRLAVPAAAQNQPLPVRGEK